MAIGRRTAEIVGTLLLIILLSAGLAFAIPPVINYQGKLVDSVGDPVNTDVDITFTIYNAPTGGDVLWTETQTVGVVNGIFNVYLGIIEEITVSTFSNDAVYLGIQVAGNAEMTPRQLYSAAPFAFRAHSADMVAEGAVTSAMIENGTITNIDIATDTITSNEIASGAVNTSELADGSVTSAKLDVASVNDANIATGAVNTAQIATGAVTTDKILDGTITDADMDANAAISASKINRNDLNADWLDGKDSQDFAASAHQHSGGDITDGTITGNDIADDAVSSISILDGSITDADINSTANISASKINTFGLNADKLDGLESTDFSRKYAKVAVVALSGGDYTSPVAAANDYLTWCGTPSIDNPCLIKVMPGVYDIGVLSVTLRQFLNIEGSGINSTLITGANTSTVEGVIKAASDSEIKHMTIENTSTFNYGVPIYGNNASFRVYDVRLLCSSATTTCYGIRALGGESEVRMAKIYANGPGANRGIDGESGASFDIFDTEIKAYGGSGDTRAVYASNSDFFLSNSEVTASSTIDTTNWVMGVYLYESSGEMHNVIAEATGGAWPRGVHIESSITNSTVIMRNVEASVYTTATSPTARGISVQNTHVEIEGVNVSVETPNATGGEVYGLYVNVQSGGSADTVRDVSVIAESGGGGTCYGMRVLGISGGYIPMANVRAYCFSASTNYGISINGGDYRLKGMDAIAYGGGQSYGLYMSGDYVSMQGVDVLGVDGTSANYGIYNYNTDVEGMDVKAQGESGNATSTNYGLYLNATGASTVRLEGGRLKATGGANTYGIRLNYASLDMNRVNIQAVNGSSSNIGLYASGSNGSVEFRHSTIEAATSTVSLTSGYPFRAALTGFIGPKPAAVVESCVNSYQDSGGTFTALMGSCN